MINVYRTHEGSTRLGIIVAGRVLDCRHRPLKRVTYSRPPTTEEREAFDEIWRESADSHYVGVFGLELYFLPRGQPRWIETLSPYEDDTRRWPIEILRTRLAEVFSIRA